MGLLDTASGHVLLSFRDEAERGRMLAAHVRMDGEQEIDHAQLLRQIVSFVQQLRSMDLRKLPSVSETLDWARALLLLHASHLDVDIVRDTLNVLLKFEQDMDAVGKQVLEFVEKAKAEAAL